MRRLQMLGDQTATPADNALYKARRKNRDAYVETRLSMWNAAHVYGGEDRGGMRLARTEAYNFQDRFAPHYCMIIDVGPDAQNIPAEQLQEDMCL